MPDQDKEVFTIEEVCRKLGVGRSTGYKSVKTGEIPSIKVGRRYVVPKTAFQKFLEGAGKGKTAA